MEIYKDIKSFPGYQISNKGNVKSFKIYKEGKIRTLLLDPDGYLILNLHRDLKRVSKRVHLLVLEAFTPNTDNKKTGNHKDFNRSNNCLKNLEWATQQENIEYSKSHKRYKR